MRRRRRSRVQLIRLTTWRDPFHFSPLKLCPAPISLFLLFPAYLLILQSRTGFFFSWIAHTHTRYSPGQSTGDALAPSLCTHIYLSLIRATTPLPSHILATDEDLKICKELSTSLFSFTTIQLNCNPDTTYLVLGRLSTPVTLAGGEDSH